MSCRTVISHTFIFYSSLRLINVPFRPLLEVFRRLKRTTCTILFFFFSFSIYDDYTRCFSITNKNYPLRFKIEAIKKAGYTRVTNESCHARKRHFSISIILLTLTDQILNREISLRAAQFVWDRTHIDIKEFWKRAD